jgi:hypothetical protein
VGFKAETSCRARNKVADAAKMQDPESKKNASRTISSRTNENETMTLFVDVSQPFPPYFARPRQNPLPATKPQCVRLHGKSIAAAIRLWSKHLTIVNTQQGVRLGASQCVHSTDRPLFWIKGRAYATKQLASYRAKMASGYVVHAVSVIKDQTEIDMLIVQMQDAITRFVGSARSSMLRMWREWKQKTRRVPHRVITPIGVCNRTPAVWANTAEERERNKTSEAVEPWSFSISVDQSS